MKLGMIHCIARSMAKTILPRARITQRPQMVSFCAIRALSPAVPSTSSPTCSIRHVSGKVEKSETIVSPISTASTDDDDVFFTPPPDLCFVTDPIQLIRLIRDEHAKNGTTFILPWGDPDAMEVAAKAFQLLLSEGVLPEFLFDACMKRESLFVALTKNGPQMIAIIQMIMEYTGMTYENAIRFVSNWTEELLQVTPDSIIERLNVFTGRGVLSGEQIYGIICKCPPLLFARDPQKMDVSLETMSEFFPPADMKQIMLASPQVALQEADELALRYEYIYFHMAIEQADFPECIRWHELPLEEIMARHEVLRRTGKYVLPDPKRPQLQMENPPMYRIFDTDDMTFATQVAGIRKAEWMLFRELFAKERAQRDMEVPYERIKPSLRKSFERKRETERATRMSEESMMDCDFY